MGIQTGMFLLTIGALLLFGTLYATLINWMRRSGYLEGFTAFMVVGGVIITLILNTAVHHPDPAIDLLIELACFAASGLPMIIEASFLDYANRRSQHLNTLTDQTNNEVQDVT
jgi:dolichol kinase